MHAVIPTAGQGTRLYPHTYTKPKPMVRLAGKPIVGHILSNFVPTAVDHVVMVVGGPMQEQVTAYAEDAFGDRFEFTFVEQPQALGLGHSIYQAAPVVSGDPIIIALGDMLFKHDYGTMLDAHRELGDVDGSLGVKRVDEPQYYGIVEVDDGRIRSMEEKPSDPASNLAISGIYIIEDSPLLFECLEELIDNDIRGVGDEFQLTDALSGMLDRGASLGTFPVSDWYDCGRPETLLVANQVALDWMKPHTPDSYPDAVIVDPVDIGPDVEIRESVVGPYVSIDAGTSVVGSLVRDSIVGRSAEIRNVNIADSIVGDNTKAVGESNSLNIGDFSSIRF